jgi:hypothetical protein
LAATSGQSADIPDSSLTPGVIASTDLGEICMSDGRPGSAYSRAHRETNERDRRADFARYGIPWPAHREYEDDHLVPLCLGGADAPANRWPEPRWGAWNAYEKDQLEGYACRMVCAGRIDLHAAQGWFLAPADWKDAYHRIFGGQR